MVPACQYPAPPVALTVGSQVISSDMCGATCEEPGRGAGKCKNVPDRGLQRVALGQCLNSWALEVISRARPWSPSLFSTTTSERSKSKFLWDTQVGRDKGDICFGFCLKRKHWRGSQGGGGDRLDVFALCPGCVHTRVKAAGEGAGACTAVFRVVSFSQIAVLGHA